MSNQFELEQALMTAWTTEDDLALLAEHTLDYAESYDVDDVVNALVGLQRLHHLRMQKVWDVFEALLDAKFFASTDDADAELDDELNDDELVDRLQKCKWPRDSER